MNDRSCPLLESLEQRLLLSTTISDVGGTVSYTENASPVILDSDVTVTGTAFAGGDILIDMSGGEATDVLSLTSDGDVNASGAISLDGISVYLGNGSGRDKIGEVDGTLNGTGGQDLKILMSSPMTNASFETGTTDGWTVSETGLPGDNTFTGTRTTTVINDPGQAADGSYFLKLDIAGNTTSYGVVHGPQVTSSYFEASTGDSIVLNWYAQQTGDDYDVYGFLVDDATSTTTQIFYERGGTTSGWRTETIVLGSSSSQFKFNFVCGSYDASGGMYIASTLGIDNARVYSSQTSAAVVESIIEHANFSSTSESPSTSDRTYVVTVRDNEDVSDTSSAGTIQVVATNDDPTIDNQTLGNLAENSANSTSVGTVSADDVDAGDSLTYSITAGNGAGAFAIDSGTGEITVADSSVLDFETTPTFSLTVEVEDTSAATDSATVTINLTDVNDAPAIDNQTLPNLAENSANSTSVGTVSADDEDSGDSLTYSITAGNGAGAFAIDSGTGEITVADSSVLDFETTPTFSLTVGVEDTGALTDSATVTINLTDLNEAPTIDNQTLPNLAENSVNSTSVGTVSADDVDTGDSLTYSITAGNDAGAFAIDAGTGEITVADSSVLDFETTPTFSLTVEVEDTGALTDSATVTVNLTNVDEPPTVGSLSPSPASLMKSEELTLTAGDVDDDATVAKVAFYHDANTNGQVDDGELLGEDDDGADGWSYALDTTPLNAGVQTFLARAQDDGDNWSDVVSTQSTITPFALTWTSGDVVVTAYDMGGTIDMARSDFRVRFGSGGTVSITLVGTNSMDALGLVIRGDSTVGSILDCRKGELGDVAFLATNGAMGKSRIKGNVTGYDLNGQTLGGIPFAADADGDGETDDLTGVYCGVNARWLAILGDLTGDIVAQGRLRRLRVVGDASDVDIVVGPADNARQASVLSFGTATNVNVSSEMPLGLVQAGQWLKDGQASLIQAPAMTTLLVNGDFQGDVELGAAKGSTGSLGVAKITGDLSDSTWIATGPVGNVTALGGVDGLTLEAGELGTLKLGDVQAADVTVTGGATLIWAQRWSAGTIEAETIAGLYIAGSARDGLDGDLGADVTLTAAAGAQTSALRRMVVAGAMTGATLTSNASLGTATIGQMINSNIIAGVKDGVTGLPADAADFADAADDSLRPNLASLRIRGVAGQDSFVNSVVAAWSMGTVKLANVLADTPASASAFGLAASALRRYVNTRDGATVYAWTSNTSPWPADDADDFAIVKIV